MADKGWYWFDKYKDKGIYNKNDQISTKAAKTRRYIDDQEAIGKQKTNQRLQNARQKQAGYGNKVSRDDKEEIRKKVEDVFKQARRGKF